MIIGAFLLVFIVIYTILNGKQINSDASDTSNSFFTTDKVHSISISYDEKEYKKIIEAYQKDGSKKWLSADVTIDGTTFKNVGLKLKGNSTVKQALGTDDKLQMDKIPANEKEISSTENSSSSDTSTTSSTDGTKSSTTETTTSGESNAQTISTAAEDLPWIIRLNKYVDGQSYKNRTDFVIRSNNTETSLNEAVALAMLNESGVVAENSAFTRFSANGSEEKLRLVVDTPDDDLWVTDHFDGNGLLYKAAADGDYSYRGTEASDYTDIFKQKYGAETITPLATFLEFINNSTDEEFSEKLENYLDVDAFATYLVMQDLVANDDDIDGPGNNSYLYYDNLTKKMTVVAWDQNLSFGGMGNMGNGGPGDGTGQPPEMPTDGERPELPDNLTENEDMDRQDPPEQPNGGEMKENILVKRFEANSTFKTLIETKKAELTTTIIDSNFASKTLESYKTLLEKEATDLVDKTTIQSDSDTITSYLEKETES